MPGATAESFDFFLSRRGSVAAIAQEVADLLAAADYKVFVQDYDGASFVEAMHDGVKNARGLLIFKSEGDLAGARLLFERALAIKEKALGPDHLETASGLNSLGQLLQAERDFAGARPLFERALAIREKTLGSEHPRTITTRNALAKLRESS
jgi:tetratricopeptide (TPR) repeat protein